MSTPGPTPPAQQDPARILASLASQGVSLELSSLDLCFALALYLRAREAGLTSFTEERLIDVFEQVCDVLEPTAEKVRARATHAIRRLREQRVLARVDGAGVVRRGQFALSHLGAGIVEFFLEEDVLTRESLTVLTRTLRTQLQDLNKTAEQATTSDAWADTVVAPLRITIRDLADGIERRQRGLDHQREQLQREVGRLLETDWFGAIDRCQSLLDTMAATLRELNEILLKDTHELLALLHDILEAALAAGEPAAELAAQRLLDQIDRIAAWGSARQKAWSEYYEYVHAYLRDVVRLDPTRALSQRLREQLMRHTQQPFSLVVARAQPIAVLRDVALGNVAPPVRRNRKEREPELDVSPSSDVLGPIDQQVRQEIARGVEDLGTLTARITQDLPEEQRFVTAGRVAQLAARFSQPWASWERAWAQVDPSLFIEQWKLTGEVES